MGRHKIAVVGSGIAGLGAAWLLARRHDVTLIEQEARLGGHSNTVEMATPDGPIAVDTGFIVYNTASYPNLIALFAALGVPTAPTRMSFAVSLDDGSYEYKGSGAGLFGQPSNLIKADHWRMAADILRFFKLARALEAAGNDHGLSLGAWLAANGFSRAFTEQHILPMGAAIWSTPARDILDFPALAFARFFANHGLLQVRNRPEWRTVVGGSRVYVGKMVADQPIAVVSGNGARRIVRRPDEVEITLGSGSTLRFDHVVIATHADQALALLADGDALERGTLSCFRYAPNRAVLHGDPSLMPKRRRLWASWNFIGTDDGRLAVSYWMNSLQPLPTRQPCFVTLNPVRPPAAELTVASYDYTHPMFDAQALAAQRELWALQGRRRTWFAGSYFGYGFHEDALQAGLAVAEDLGDVARPWRVDEPSGRIHRGARPKLEASVP